MSAPHEHLPAVLAEPERVAAELRDKALVLLAAQQVPTIPAEPDADGNVLPGAGGVALVSTLDRLIALHGIAGRITRDTWRERMNTLSMAAALNGDYKSAVEGMKSIGESFGHVNNKSEQHLHLHGVDADKARELPVQDLEQRKREIEKKLKEAKNAEVVEAPPNASESDYDALG